MKNQHNNIISKMLNDRMIRITTVRQSHYWFFHFYFPHYVIYETALFQKEFFALTEKENIFILAIAAFRNSAKSSILNSSQTLWSILGREQRKFVLILSQTQDKAQYHLNNIKKELENNDLLKRDLGPFQEESNQWGLQSLFISKFNAKISANSLGQSIRGVRHRQYRPDLIIIDDLEDLDSIRTEENRKKTLDWFSGEVLPCGDKNTKIVVIGNLLREGTVLDCLKKEITSGKLNGIYKEYPIIDENKKPLWPGKFPTQKDMKIEKQKAMMENSWQREFMLNPIEDTDRVVHPKDIHYYKEINSNPDNYRYAIISVDPAISKENNADFTGIVMAKIYGYGKNIKIYILPNPINKRMDSLEMLETIKQKYLSLSQNNVTRVFIEDVGFQRMIAQQLNNEHIRAEEIKICGDKKMRLWSVSNLIQEGKVLFPEKGAEILINQIIDFGIEKYDDLVDAFTLLIAEIIRNNKSYGHLTDIDDDINKPRLITAGLLNKRF